MEINVGLFVQKRTIDQIQTVIIKPVRSEQAFAAIRSARDYPENHHPFGGFDHINS
jgi:hypothetical protein